MNKDRNKKTPVKNVRKSKSAKKEKSLQKKGNVTDYNLFTKYHYNKGDEFLNSLPISQRPKEISKLWKEATSKEKKEWKQKAADYNSNPQNASSDNKIKNTSYKKKQVIEDDLPNKKGKTSIKKTLNDMGFVKSDVKQVPKPIEYEILKLKFSLEEVTPIITRTVKIPPDFNFCQLHHCIQDSFNFHDTAVHLFTLQDKVKIGPELNDLDLKDENNFLVKNYLNSEHPSILYEYKNEDNWKIKVEFISTLMEKEKLDTPLMVEGFYANPPENVGGPKGFLEFINVMKNPKDKEYEMFNQWYLNERIGSDSTKFNFENFDTKKIKFRKTSITYVYETSDT